MKKGILGILIIAACIAFSFGAGEAFVYDVFGPSLPGIVPDDMTILDRTEIDGFSHGVVTFNNAQDPAIAVVLDPDGTPDSFPYGYAYLWADLLTGDLYVSNDFLTSI